MSPYLVIGISGVTCGGKTTLSRSLRDYFHQKRNTPLWNTPYLVGDVQLVSQDDYFLPVNDVRHKWNETLNVINFELLSSLDMKQMLSDVSWMLKGRYSSPDLMDNIDYINEMAMSTNFEHHAAPPLPTLHYHQNHSQNHSNLPPHYNKPKHHSQKVAGSVYPSHIMRVNSQLAAHLRGNKINILILEGFLILNQPQLLALCDIKFHVHIPYEKCFERRSKRTYDPPDVTGYFEICVWPQYEKNFAEIRDRQDVTFLNGDLSKERILKFVVQKIANHIEERCDMPCPPPQKLVGIPSCAMNNDVRVDIGLNLDVGVGISVGLNCSNNGDGSSGLNDILAKAYPMEQQ